MTLVHLGCSLKQTGMKIEHITWVSLTTGWSSQQEGHLTVSNSLLREIVVDDQSMLAVVTEVLTDGAGGVGSQELKWSGFGSGSSYDHRVFQTVLLLEKSHDVSDCGSLLTDGDVDAVETLGVLTFLVDSLLVNDCVDSNGCLASLSISNDKFTLASSDWHLL